MLPLGLFQITPHCHQKETLEKEKKIEMLSAPAPAHLAPASLLTLEER
jgi:hypothetical protein